jgi:archaellum biogenesis ATPase FlaH
MKGDLSSPDAERMVLGLLLNGAVDFAAISLDVEDFTQQQHRLVFAAIGEVHRRGLGIDYRTVYDYLREVGKDGSIEGIGWLVELDKDTPRFPHPDSYVRIIREKTERRNFARRAQRLADHGLLPEVTFEALRAETAATLASLNGAGHAPGRAEVDIDSIPSIYSYEARNIEFAVEGLIACGCVTLISGESGCGKSTLVTAMAGAVARGGEFAGRRCAKRKVLILDRENGIEVVRERFERLGIAEDGPLVWGGWLEEEVPAPNAPRICQWIERTDPKPLIVIDTCVTFLEGDENSATDVRRLMDRLRQLANLGAAVIGLHHSGKADTAKDYRGSSYFKGGSDVALQMTNFGGAELSKMNLKAFKSRFSMDREIVLTYVNGRFVSDSRPYAATRTVTEQLTKLLSEHPLVMTKEFEDLAASQGLPRNRARDYLANGVEVGEIEQTPGPRNSRYHRLIAGPE